MNEKFHNSNFKNLPMTWEKYVFHWEKWNFEPIANSADISKLRKSPEYLYRLFYVLFKQTTREMKTL